MPTAIQPRVTESPGGGLIRNVDPRHVPETAWVNGRNIRFPTGRSRVRKTDGYQLVDNIPTGRPLAGLWWYVEPTGAREPALVQIGFDLAWIDLGFARTGIAAFDPPRTIDDIVTIDQYKEHLIWADGKAVWDWLGHGAAIPLGGGASTAKLVEIHKDHILLGNITKSNADGKKQPWRVEYSRFGVTDPETGQPDFTGETSGFQDFLEDATEITALKVLGDHVVVHKPNRLSRLIYVGPPDHYIIEGIPADEGSISARGAISVGSYQYYIGHTNIYRLASFAEPIGDAIWPEVAAAIDWPRAHRTFAYRRDEWDEICWKIPTRGAAQPDLTAAFNYRDQTWTLTDHDPGTCAAQVPSDGLKSTQFEDDLSPKSPPTTRDVFGQLSGQIHVYTGRNANGAAIHAWVESRHITEQLIPTKIVAVPIFATGSGFLTVRLRAAMDARQPFTPWPPAINVHPSAVYFLPPPAGSPPVPLVPASQTRPWIDVRAYGRLWQVRIESGALNDDWELAAWGTAVIPGAYAR